MNRGEYSDETNDTGYCGIRALREDDTVRRVFGANGSSGSVGRALRTGCEMLEAGDTDAVVKADARKRDRIYAKEQAVARKNCN